MESSVISSLTSPPEIFTEWIRERWCVKEKKEKGLPKPWSVDPIFQQTYFCNVRREDDTVTKWIRNRWGQYVMEENYELAMILARFVNWPDTLRGLGFPFTFNPDWIYQVMETRMESGHKTWGNAYVITTHGLNMGKVAYLVKNVLEGARQAMPAILKATRCVGSGPLSPRLERAYNALIQLEGLGSFLAAQVVADLKNTPEHPLEKAEDWWTWCAPGPGSLRGMSWFFYNEPGRIKPDVFKNGIDKIRKYTDSQLAGGLVPQFCNQDLQNCLCEFDKYMRIRNGTGKSKRKYNGG